MRNNYNSKVSTLQLELPNSDVVLPSLTSGVDYTLDLPTLYGRDYIRFNLANGSTITPTLGGTLPFNKEDRPILRNVSLMCNFADGLVLTAPQIETKMLVNNVDPIDGGFSTSGGGALNQIVTRIPVLNKEIPIERFIPVTYYDSLPVSITNANGVFDSCKFLYFEAFSFTWKTNTIDSVFDGSIPQFVLQAEIEHTFELGVIGACV